MPGAATPPPSTDQRCQATALLRLASALLRRPKRRTAGAARWDAWLRAANALHGLGKA